MPQSMFDLLNLLQTQAQPRPDINTPGSTGVLENSRPYTFAGRVGDANQPSSLASMMNRMPTESPDAEGLGSVAAGAGTVLLPKWKPYMKLPNAGFDEQRLPYTLNVRVTDPETGQQWIDAVKGLNRGHAAAAARANWWGMPIEILSDKAKK